MPVRALVIAAALRGASAAHPHKIYEQLLAAPHAPEFWSHNPLRPAGWDDGSHAQLRGVPASPPPP